jgi:D-cysteine desulfhydrase
VAVTSPPSVPPKPPQLPRRPLAVLPTPLVEAPELAAALGIAGRLLVKRDDLTGFAVAGNKARQLEFLVADAVEQGADVLVTGGSASSNFIQAAAAAAAHACRGCELATAGSQRPRPWPPNLAAAAAWGARITWTDDDDRASVDVALPTLADRLAGNGARPYLMPRGGASPVGCEGYRRAAAELVDQLPTTATAPTVVIAVGAGGTMAGLLAGAVAFGRPFTVVGASVSRPPEQIRDRVLELAGEVAKRHGDEPPQPGDVRIVDARGPGHGVASDAGRAAARTALRNAGLVLDPVYTAKAMGIIPDLAAEGPIVFWHTGGLLDAVGEWVTTNEAGER